MKTSREKFKKLFMTLHSIFKITGRIGKGSFLIAALTTFVLLSTLNGFSPAREVFSGQPSAVTPYEPSAALPPSAVKPHRLPAALQPSGIFLSRTELAKGNFIVASSDLKDPNFSKTVVLLVEYGWQGATGLIINRPTDVKLSKVLPEIEKLARRKDRVYIGGPVASNWMMMLIVSEIQPEESHHVFGDIYVSSSLALLQRLIDSKNKEERFHVYSGYAVWAPGQLVHEISRGDWLILQADENTVFDKNPSEIWLEMVRRSTDYWVKERKVILCSPFLSL
ncbi:hypothetical protein ES703_109224 [subsurface metagenome]